MVVVLLRVVFFFPSGGDLYFSLFSNCGYLAVVVLGFVGGGGGAFYGFCWWRWCWVWWWC